MVFKPDYASVATEKLVKNSYLISVTPRLTEPAYPQVCQDIIMH